ncbi:MAG: Toxin [Rhodospirillales bacterium]|nr:Toxin [Rhodospirillales bacterium]
MSGYVLSPLAKAAIEEIWNYMLSHWSVRQAEISIRQIQAAIETLAADGMIVRSRETI